MTGELVHPAYSSLRAAAGRESSLASIEFDRLTQTAGTLPKDPIHSYDAFYDLQESVHARQAAGELSIDQMMEELEQLSLRYHGVRRQQEAARSLADFSESAVIYSSLDGAEVIALNALFALTRSPEMARSTPAPFAHYSSNTEQYSRIVTDATVRRLLGQRCFISDRTLSSAYSTPDTATHIDRSSQLFQIPTDSVVTAVGFSSWMGRPDEFGRRGKGNKTIALQPYAESDSYTTIKAYANKPTELPPVTKLDVFVQPDGLALASNGGGGGDSHRIGAAILRGQEFITSEEVGVYLLKENVLDRLL